LHRRPHSAAVGVTQDFFGAPRYARLQLEQNGSKLSGELNGDKLEGTVSGSTIHFVARNQSKDTFEVQGTFTQGILTATMVATDSANRDHPYTFSVTAKPAPPLEHRAPQRHDFTPTVFYRQFSALNKPVLTIAPCGSCTSTYFASIAIGPAAMIPLSIAALTPIWRSKMKDVGKKVR
jgi:hypothetical protein